MCVHVCKCVCACVNVCVCKGFGDDILQVLIPLKTVFFPQYPYVDRVSVQLPRSEVKGPNSNLKACLIYLKYIQASLIYLLQCVWGNNYLCGFSVCLFNL